MYARRRQSMPLDEHRLLLNGLQPTRRLRERGLLASERPSKRQRTENLNSRYDRMIQTVNSMHPSPAHTSSPKERRRQASSSSATTNGAPSTPEGAYSHRQGHSLGRDFSVLKMGGSRSSVKGSDPFDLTAFAGIGADANRSIEVLPPWLEGTISTLETRNPLRLLLSDDVATGEEHGRYAQHASSAAVASCEEGIPLALTSLKTLPAASKFLEEPLASLTRTLAIQTRPSINMKLADWASRVRDHFDDTVSLELPFSTPGPASLLPSPVPAPPPAYPPPLIPAVSQRPLDASISSIFSPFAKPGPCSSTEHTTRAPAAERIHLHQQVNSAPVQETTSGIPRLLLSPLHTLPFSTPGPMPQHVEGNLSTDTNVRFVESSAHENLTFHISPSLHYQPQQGSTPDLLYSSPVPIKLPTSPSLASPCSSFVEGSLFSLRDEREDPAIARPRSPLVPCDQYALACDHINYTALDFKWERFDRGDVVVDSTLVSSPGALPGSEETFWSRPARRLPALAPPFQRQDGPELDSSPASLRLTGISTPLPTSTCSPRKHFDPTKGDFGRLQDGNPFAWIVPSRHAGPPSTPPSKKSSSRRTPGNRDPPHSANQSFLAAPASKVGSTQAEAWPQWRPPDVADADASETQQPEPRPATRRVPFAPSADIYISPLQNTSDIGDTAGDMNGACKDELQPAQRPRRTNRTQAGSTGDRLSTSGSCLKEIRRRRGTASYVSARDVPSTTAPRQDDQVEAPETNDGQGVSQSTIICSTQPGGSSCDGEEDEIDEVEEVEEDQLEGCSQETRDTIESWTA